MIFSILRLGNLPNRAKNEDLKKIFGSVSGVKNIKYNDGNDYALIKFDDSIHAFQASIKFKNFKIPSFNNTIYAQLIENKQNKQTDEDEMEYKSSDKKKSQDMSLNVVGVIQNPKEKEIVHSEKKTAKQRYWEKKKERENKKQKKTTDNNLSETINKELSLFGLQTNLIDEFASGTNFEPRETVKKEEPKKEEKDLGFYNGKKEKVVEEEEEDFLAMVKEKVLGKKGRKFRKLPLPSKDGKDGKDKDGKDKTNSDTSNLRRRDNGALFFEKRIAKDTKLMDIEDLDNIKKEREDEEREDEEAVQEQIKLLFTGETFDSLSLSEKMTKSLTESNKIQKPTKVQALSIPLILSGNDLFMKAETGSGKTLAYLIPLVEKLQKLSDNNEKINREDGTRAIIIAPTRELVVQIENELKNLTQKKYPYIISSSFVGGEKKKSEKARIRKGIVVLIATPGRLLDHINNTHSFKYDKLEYVVFDEADRLMDMGFKDKIAFIMKKLKQNREKPPQVVLASATLWEGLKPLVGVTLTNPKFIDSAKETQHVESDGKRSRIIVKDLQYYDNKVAFSTPKTLQQKYINIECKKKLSALIGLLRWKITTSKDTCKMIIFLANRDSVNFHYALISNATIQMVEGERKARLKKESVVDANLFKLHGGMTQIERTETFKKFVELDKAIMFCTDVAARGLDLPHVDWIIQYDPPGEPKEYIHRVGRTARLGKKGTAILFLLPSEMEYLGLLEGHSVQLKELKPEKIWESLDIFASASQGMGSDLSLQIVLEREVIKNNEIKAMAESAYFSCTKSYATHARGTKHIFHLSKLHLGHLAKSFALRDIPTRIIEREKTLRREKRDELDNKKVRHRNKNEGFDEERPRFNSGSNRGPNNNSRGGGSKNNRNNYDENRMSTRVSGGNRMKGERPAPKKRNETNPKKRKMAELSELSQKRQISVPKGGFSSLTKGATLGNISEFGAGI